MQVMSPDDQILNQFATNEKIHTQKKYKSDCKKYRKSYRLYTEKVTISSGAISWPNLELMQVAPSGG